MAFGWFSKNKDDAPKLTQKAHKLANQSRWAEALPFYLDALESGEDQEDARAGARRCREQLVALNLEEARGCAAAEDQERAVEHARLARDLAGDEPDLVQQSDALLAELDRLRPQSAPPGRPERMFPSSCSCAATCDADGAGVQDEGFEEDPADLFEFYLDSLSEAEREAMEPCDDEFRRGFVLLQQGDLREARGHLEEAQRQHPDQAAPPYTLGMLAALEDAPEQSVAHFRRARDLAPEFAPALHHLADLLRETGRAQEGAALLDGWLAGHPEDGEAWLLTARCRGAAEDGPGALQALERAKPHLPEGDVRPTLLRAHLLNALGSTEDALNAYVEVANRRPDLLEALVPLGRLLLAKGGAQAERAAEVFKKTYRLDPERGWWHLLRIAEAYGVRGWRDEALEMIEAARSELPEGPEPAAEWQRVREGLES